MDKRKELVGQYKQRRLHGGVYRVTNTFNGKYLLSHAVDLKAAQNRFDFLLATGSCVPYELQKDWEEFGGKAFAFEVLEGIDIKQGQSEKQFSDDLVALEQLWRNKLDASKEY